MTHRIYAGSFAALEARLLETIAEEQAGDPLAPVAVLVGSNLLAAYLKGRMAAPGRTSANVRFHTFPDLVETLGAGAHTGRRKPRLPHLGASLLIEDVLEAQTPEVFSRVSSLAGFRGALLDTFRDLRDAGITPDFLDQARLQLRGLTPDRESHLLALASLYRGFAARVASFQDVADDFRRAMAPSAMAAAGAALGTRSLLIYGIYDVTGLQADLLRCLKDSLNLTCYIPYVEECSSKFAAPFLESRVRELGATPVMLSPEGSKNSLSVLAQRIFSASAGTAEGKPAPTLAADGSFGLISVPGESRTAVEVIREILRAIREGVITGYYEAAVILRRAEDEVSVMTEAFRLRGIPCFVHGGTSFSQRPLARAVLAIAGLETEAFSRRAILTAMELIAAALPAGAAESWDVPQWRALVNDARFLAGIDAWDAGTEARVREMQLQLRRAGARVAGGEDEEESERLLPSIAQARRRLESAESLRRAWAALKRAASAWPAVCTWQEWAQLLQERLERLLDGSEDWQAFSMVFDSLSTLGELPRETAARQVPRARIAAALAEALADLRFPEGSFQRRGVNLLSAAAARGLRFSLVIIPGLDEGRFPARLRQDPLLLDSERQQIGRPPRLPLKSLRGEEEKLLFDMAVRSAEKRLVLTTSRLDEASDREGIPSQFFLRCAAAVRGASLNLNELTPENVPGLRTVSLDDPGPGKGQMPIDEGEIRLGLITAEPSAARAALAAIAHAEPPLLNGPIAYDRARWIHGLTEFDGHIQDRALRHWVAAKLSSGASQLSASRVEEYARCPYLFYLRRIQELEKWEEEEQVEAMDPLERGQVIHSILEGFLREFSGAGFVAAPLPTLQEALQARARVALEASRTAAMPDLLWEIERDRLLAMLQNWLLFERKRGQPDIHPFHLERSFGAFTGEETSPPYCIQGRQHAFEFRGRIDRIDVSNNGKWARVIDYKTGVLPKTMSEGKRTQLMAGEKIQLAIYCGALSVMPDMAAVQRIDGEYLHLQPAGGDTAPCAFDDAELRSAIQRLPEMLEIMREGMDTGVFFARTRGSVRPQGHCSYCDFLRICGKDRVQREESKATDPAVARFARLQEIDGAGEDEE
jgi:RecB family exonuclease